MNTTNTVVQSARIRLKEIDKQDPSDMSIETLREASHLQHILFMSELKGLSTIFDKLQEPLDEMLEKFDDLRIECEHLEQTIEESDDTDRP